VREFSSHEEKLQASAPPNRLGSNRGPTHELLGDRGRGQVQRAGSTGHTPVRGDSLEHTQPARIDHPEVQLSLYGR
jgi:hypothetical protein